MTIASYITSLRILFILPIIYLTSLESFESNFLALLLFIIAGLTDYLDGYVARKTNTESQLGALLDLLADKLLVCIILVWLIALNNDLVFTIPALIILSRELVISSVRQFIVEKTGGNNIEVSLVAKSKTTIQFIAISFLIISPGLGNYVYYIAFGLLWIAACISLFSLYDYLQSWKESIRS